MEQKLFELVSQYQPQGDQRQPVGPLDGQPEQNRFYDLFVNHRIRLRRKGMKKNG